jgi:hypothetical protein
VRSYADYVLSFDYPWAFVAASAQPVWEVLSGSEIDRRLRDRGIELRFYDGDTHQRVMHLPRPLRRLIAEEATVISDSEPLVVL